MKELSTFGFLQLSKFAKPACDRSIYKQIKKHKFRSIVEIGLGDGTRCINLIRVAQKYSDESLRYTGVDMFDDRDAQEAPLKLIEMHRTLKGLPAKTQLVPGGLMSSVPRIANAHLRTDLMIVSAGFDPDELASAMMFIPRMLHPGSVLLIQNERGGEFRELNRLDIERQTKAA